jgi:8-oxo-dGTP diphosphatase
MEGAGETTNMVHILLEHGHLGRWIKLLECIYQFISNIEVEEGEPLDKAVIREFLEETNVIIQPKGITGVYYNATSHILTVMFYGEYVSGTIKIQTEEIKEAKFVALTESNIDQYITRPHVKSRTLDAMAKKSFVPYESWNVNPYELLGRLGENER